MIDIKSTLKRLSDAVGIGNINESAKLAEGLLAGYAEITQSDNSGIIGEIKGMSDYTLMFEAHFDEIGFIVTDIDENGFLTVQNCGGFDLRTLPSRQVDIHGKEKVRGVFCSTPPHLAEKDVTFDKISDFKIDTCLGKKAKEIISVGDYATYSTKADDLTGDRMCGKSFDDRAGVCVLLELASRFKDITPPVNLVFCLANMEEIGHRGAKTASFKVSPDEAIAIDVSFGDGPDISPDDCGKIGGGAMIGVSPIIDRVISDKLIHLANDKKIPYQVEVMSQYTGTDADVISVTKSGVRTGLGRCFSALRRFRVSVPLSGSARTESRWRHTSR